MAKTDKLGFRIIRAFADARKTAMKDYYIVFAHSLQPFRLQELHAVCDFFGISICYDVPNLDLAASQSAQASILSYNLPL